MDEPNRTPAIFTPEYAHVARAFIDFVNAQVGAYSDACSGFSKNRSLIERQVHRINQQQKVRTGEGNAHIVMATVVEDPSQPDVIMHRIVLASEYLAANAVAGSNEQQHARASITFLFAYWDEEVRPSLARALGVAINEIVSDIFGDIRLIRNAILHNKGILLAKDHRRLKLMQEHFQADGLVSLPNATMHRLFYLVKSDMAQRIFSDSGMAGAETENVIEVALQNIGKQEPD